MPRLGCKVRLQSIQPQYQLIRLAREPEQIRLGEIVRRSEGEAPIVECLGEEHPTCRIAPNCRLTEILVGAFEALYRELDAYTLADLVDNGHQLSRMLFVPRAAAAASA